MVGCTPKQRIQNEALACHEELNSWAMKYNDGFKSSLEMFKSEFNDTNYSYFDTYSALTDFIQNPHKYGTLYTFLFIHLFLHKNYIIQKI